jgi:hypothetical protein
LSWQHLDLQSARRVAFQDADGEALGEPNHLGPRFIG